MADVGRELADRELRKLERKLSHEYAQAEKELRKKREEFTKEYQKELKKKKALLEKGELTKERYKQWLEQQALYESWVSEMADYMANEQVNANRRAAEIMNNATPKVYAEAFNFGTFLVEDAVGIDTMFTLYNADTVARLMKDNPKLLPEANIDVPKDKRWNYQKMKTSLVQSVLQGESVSKMAKRLRRVTDMNKTSAVRNARTMFVGAENSGRFDSFQRAIDLGIEMKKMWSATMDSRTRNSHAVLDGETVELNEKFSNGLMYPGDPDGSPSEVYNCRCRLSAQLAGFERNNRHVVDGENVAEEQYQAWKNAHRTAQKISNEEVRVGKDTASEIVNHKVLKEKLETYVSGGYSIDELLTESEKTYLKEHSVDYHRPMYRVEEFNFTAEKLDWGDLDFDDFEFSGTFRSFSRKESVIRDMLDDMSDEYAYIEHPVIFETVGTVKQFDMSPYTDNYMTDQAESLVWGHFKVVGQGHKIINGEEVLVIKIKRLKYW